MNKKTIKKNLASYIFLILLMIGIYYVAVYKRQNINNINYGDFLSEIEKNNVSEIVIVPNSTSGVYEISGRLKTYGENESFYFKIPMTDTVMKQILNSDQNKLNFKITTKIT